MRAMVLALLALLSLGTIPANNSAIDTDTPKPGCEPSDIIGVSARLVSAVSRGDRLQAVIDVSVRSHVILVAATVRASRGAGGRQEQILDDSLGAIPRDVVVTRRLTIDLPSRGGGFYVSVVGDGADGQSIESSTFVPVDLDPARAPMLTGDVVQYRARMGGG